MIKVVRFLVDWISEDKNGKYCRSQAYIKDVVRDVEVKMTITSTVDDVRGGIDEIESGIAAHKAWKQRLDEAISTGVSAFDVADVASDIHCEFGKWLYSPSLSKKLTGHSYYQMVCQRHAEFHEAASRVLEGAVGNDNLKVLDIAKRVDAYDAASTSLLEAIDQWRQANTSSTP